VIRVRAQASPRRSWTSNFARGSAARAASPIAVIPALPAPNPTPLRRFRRDIWSDIGVVNLFVTGTSSCLLSSHVHKAVLAKRDSLRRLLHGDSRVAILNRIVLDSITACLQKPVSSILALLRRRLRRITVRGAGGDRDTEVVATAGAEVSRIILLSRWWRHRHEWGWRHARIGYCAVRCLRCPRRSRFPAVPLSWCFPQSMSPR